MIQLMTQAGILVNLLGSNVTLPEINIKFNVKEMDFNPTLASSKASGPKALQGVFTDYIAGNPTAGSTGSPVTRYDDTTYIAGTTTLAAGRSI